VRILIDGRAASARQKWAILRDVLYRLQTLLCLSCVKRSMIDDQGISQGIIALPLALNSTEKTRLRCCHGFHQHRTPCTYLDVIAARVLSNVSFAA